MRELTIARDRGELINALKAAGAEIKGDGKSIKCPFHEDKSPSGSIYLSDDGHYRYKCFTASCGFNGDIIDVMAKNAGKSNADILRELNSGNNSRPHNPQKPADDKPKKTYMLDGLISCAEWSATEKRGGVWTLFKAYRYDNAAGMAELLVLRLHGPDGRKTFIQGHQTGPGAYVFGAPDGEWLPIYNRAGVADAGRVILVEGEKACESLLDLGFCATTCPGGANGAERVDLQPLNGKKVYLWPDNDPPNEKGERTGHIHMNAIARRLTDQQPDAKVFWIDSDRLNLPDKGDAFDLVESIKAFPLSEKHALLREILKDAMPFGPLGEFLENTEAAIAGRIQPIRMDDCENLSDLTRALLPKTVTVICGLPGASKSIFILHLVMGWFSRRRRVAVMELEDGVEFHMRRAFAWLAEDGNLVKQEWYPANADYVREQQERHKPSLDALQRVIFSPPPDKSATMAYLLTWLQSQAKNGIEIAIIDPITLADMTGGNQQWQEEARFMREAKRIAEDSGMRLILVTHPRKGAQTNTTDDLSGAAAYGRAAQTVLWIMPHELKEGTFGTTVGSFDAQYNRTVKISKARNSSGERENIAFMFDGSTFRFKELGIIKN